FWDEFGVRFNFIAVDYLVYTTEVVDNIVESYPVFREIAALAVIALLLAGLTVRLPGYRRWLETATPARARLRAGATLLLIPVVATATVDARGLPDFDNRYLEEISRNGPYSFVAAFRDNELDFHEFYLDEAPAVAEARIRGLIADGDVQFAPAGQNPERRHVEHRGPEKRYNVIQIVVESLSAEFLGTFGHDGGLTPNLDGLAKESLLFTNFMATGTRTVRGMESLVLSVPPTPGRSIVKRPENAGLFSIATVLAEKGYDANFFYGGYGYFDNMNAFFAGNGFAIHDRASEGDDDVVFTNAWGVSDGDLFRWVLEDADRRAADGKPFFDFVMTTSNHRPYTYPEGRIDIPSHTGRAGAVKYTDYAIGQFLAEARKRPWFEDTVFVIVADHCAGSAGKTSLPVERYRIPLLVYAPGLIEPGVVGTLASQIDLAPTLFGLLNWSYDSEFFGRDVLHVPTADGRALIGTYQSIGLIEHDHRLTVLSPGSSAAAWIYDPVTGEQRPVELNPDELTDTITYYQRAADKYRADVAGTATRG
ncbi:MAG: LTA synthase family protein, partial [Gammaproteobacteria bacterium]